jgi:hypothetical protein
VRVGEADGDRGGERQHGGRTRQPHHQAPRRPSKVRSRFMSLGSSHPSLLSHSGLTLDRRETEGFPRSAASRSGRKVGRDVTVRAIAPSQSGPLPQVPAPYPA